MTTRHWLRTALLACTAILGVSAANAAPVTTSGLTINTNGYTFDAFTAQVTVQNTATPGAASQIDVMALAVGTGLQFTSGFTAITPQGGLASFADALITYRASSAGGISQIGLSFDGTFLGLAVASVTETVYADAARTQQVGQAVVSCNPIAGCSQTATVTLNGTYTTVYVTKDINVSSFPPGGIAQTSAVTQSYNPTPVPEPASLALFGTGLLGLGLLRRARRKG